MFSVPGQDLRSEPERVSAGILFRVFDDSNTNLDSCMPLCSPSALSYGLNNPSFQARRYEAAS